MKKPLLLLVLLGLTAGAVFLLRQQQIDLEIRRGHVDALGAWRGSKPATELPAPHETKKP